MQPVLQVSKGHGKLYKILMYFRTSELSPQLQIAVDFADEQNGMNGHGI